MVAGDDTVLFEASRDPFERAINLVRFYQPHLEQIFGIHPHRQRATPRKAAATERRFVAYPRCGFEDVDLHGAGGCDFSL